MFALCNRKSVVLQASISALLFTYVNWEVYLLLLHLQHSHTLQTDLRATTGLIPQSILHC